VKDKLMFWKKKKSPQDSAAQHLANLVGTSVAGFVPEVPNDRVDLDMELFTRNNSAIASLVIIAGLLKGNPSQQALIRNSIEPLHLGAKSLENYLFTIVAEELRNNQVVSPEAIKQRIPEYGTVVYGEPTDYRSLQGYLFKWSQIISFEPTDKQILTAIQICQNSGKK
jgi:hypothetical protein